MLVVMAYVALVAAAYATWNDLLRELLWAVVLIAICYATVIACVGRGRRQALAAGFVAMSIIQVCCVTYAGRSPLDWVYNAAGYYESSGVLISGTDAQGHAIWADTFFANVRVTNAVATLVAGLFGCFVGALAWRNCKSEAGDGRESSRGIRRDRPKKPLDAAT
jgi:hypothetical protein